MKTFANFHKTLLNYINFKTIFSFIALVCFTQIGFGQTTIYSQGFETNFDGYSHTPSQTPSSNPGDQYFHRADPSDSSIYEGPVGPYTNVTGSWLFVGSNPKVINSGNPGILSTGAIIVTGFSDMELSIDFGAVPGDWDASDDLSVEYSWNDSDWAVLYNFTSSDTNQPLNLTNNSVGGNNTSNGITLTYSLQTIVSDNFIGSGDALYLRVVCDAGANYEAFGLDNIVLTGTASPTIGFDSASSSQTETDATFNVTIPVTVSSYSGTQIDVSVAASGTAEGGDFTLNTASLSFTADGSQNISLDINDDVDIDEETVILTITETSAVSGLVISQSTHTVTITDDEIPTLPVAGTVFITEVLDGPSTNFDYLELFNNSNETVSLSTSKLVRYTSAGSYDNFVFDFGADESGSGSDTTIPPYGFLIVARSGIRADFNTAFSITLPAGVNYNNGSGNNYFGASRRWKLRTGGTANADDGTLIDDTLIGVGADTSYKNIFTGVFTNDELINATPGALEYLVHNGGAWVNSVAMDATTASENVYFYDDYTITSDDFANDLGVASGNTLTIDETSSLTVSGDFTNNGTVTLNSTEDDFSSLIVTGTATGDITYNRYVNAYDTNALGGGWDLVGAPAGMTISAFIAANGTAGSNVIKVLDNDYAFSQYDNATGQWNRYQTASQTGSFTTGQGYSMATNAGDGATVAFTGTMQTTTQSINIIDNNDANAGAGRRWNLVSNPYPSYILGNAAAGANNFLSVNSAIIQGNYQALYGWNGSGYTPYNLTDGAGFSIAPGQAFWVAAESTTGELVSFTPEMRTTTGTGDFITGPQLLSYELALKLYNGESQKAKVKFYFKDGLSLDLDPGYDAGAFNQSMKLSTRLPQGSQETAFSINAMGIDALQNTRVPLEIRQNAGQAFTISIADMDLPQDIYVYLEDTLNGTFTSLKEQDFELTAQSDLSGLDRFFIVFKSNSVLSSGDTLDIDALNVYKANSDSFVTIAGISPELGKLNVSLYNILGQTVREKALNPITATQTISTQGLASGLYIIQLKSGNQVFTKKIVVK